VSQKLDSYDAASDLEELGGKVLELRPKDWTGILTEAQRLVS
jgi:hypothetical protein